MRIILKNNNNYKYMNTCTILVIIGTRPEAIKLCPIILELKKSTKFNPIIICTGQHQNMVMDVLSLFKIEPSLWLNFNKNEKIPFIETNKPSLSVLTSKILLSMENVISIYNPKFIMVQGDTTSAYGCALSGFYNKVPIVHVEAGLRSFNMSQPYPEEFNRVSISSFAQLHFTTTLTAKNNLLNEKISEDKCFYVGNTIVDSYKHINKNYNINVKKEKLILITCHRRENWGDPLDKLCTSIKFLCKTYPNYTFIFCSHPNPLVSNIVHDKLCETNCEIKASLPYNEFLQYILKAKIIITDSGGVQEEACITGTPTLVYRNVTERPEGIGLCLKLIGNDIILLQNEISKLITDTIYYEQISKPIKCYGDGDGDASKKIISVLNDFIK